MPSRQAEMMEVIPLMRCVAASQVFDRNIADELVELALFEAKNRGGRINNGTNLKVELFYLLQRITKAHVSGKNSDKIRELDSVGSFSRLGGGKSIAAAIKALDFDERAILILRSLGDFTYDELAAISGLSRQEVNATITKARKDLNSLLTDFENNLENEIKTTQHQPRGPERISGWRSCSGGS